MILTYGSVTGDFDDVEFSDGLDGELDFGAYSLTLSITAVPEPMTVVTLLCGLGCIATSTRRRRH